MATIKLKDGDEADIYRTFGEDRAIAKWNGVFVTIDRVDGGWVRSKRLAEGRELEVLNNLIAADDSVDVTVEKPDGG